jgi:hypothetical protein
MTISIRFSIFKKLTEVEFPTGVLNVPEIHRPKGLISGGMERSLLLCMNLTKTN